MEICHAISKLPALQIAIAVEAITGGKSAVRR